MKLKETCAECGGVFEYEDNSEMGSTYVAMLASYWRKEHACKEEPDGAAEANDGG